MKIGLSQSIINVNGVDYDAIEQGWYRTLNGHSLFFVPNTLNQDFNLMANDLDSFIITSGMDNECRKKVELELANKLIERNKPVVGVGRGMLLLAQSLNSEIEYIKNHDKVNHPIFYHREVREVNSNHDYCVKKMIENTNLLCHDYLGNVESFIYGNIAGLLWNPELMDEPWIPPEIAYMLKI